MAGTRREREARGESRGAPPSIAKSDADQDIALAESLALRREPTGVPHLDEVLGGGLPRGSLALILGLPGSGKTTLASQIAFNAARAGKSILILTALSEPSNKLIEHLASFRFFDRSLIGGPVKFLSMQGVLPEGLDAVAEAMFAETRRVHADYVLLDGFRGLRTVDAGSQEARQFLYDIGTTYSALGVTTILTSETDPRDTRFFPEMTTADVIIGLQYTLLGVRQQRGLEVVKARGAAPMPGLHALTLDDDGMTVYPQLEERVIAEEDLAAERERARDQTQANIPMGAGTGAARAGIAGEPQRGERATPPGSLDRVAFGLAEFDEMLRGGLPPATCTLLAGSLGTGKTLLALTYALSGIRAGDAVVFLSFRESRSQLRQVMQPFGLDGEMTKALEPGGRLTLMDIAPIKLNADVLADRLLATLDAVGAQRLVIDSVAELERAVLRGPDPRRLEDYLAALLHALRRRGVTAVLIKETDKVVAASLELSADALSILAENVIQLQHVPYEGHLRRVLSIPKLRFSDHDTAIREFIVRSPEGIVALGPLDSGEGVLEGITRRSEQGSSRAEREASREQSRARNGAQGERQGAEE